MIKRALVVHQRSSRYRLRSSQSNQLVVPPVKLSSYGPRSFAVAGPTTWNSLPEYLRDPELSIDTFRRQLKTLPFAQYWRRHPSTLVTFVPSRSMNLLFAYLHYITSINNITSEALSIVMCLLRNWTDPDETRQILSRIILLRKKIDPYYQHGPLLVSAEPSL